MARPSRIAALPGTAGSEDPVLEVLPAGVLKFDSQGEILFSSPEMLRLFGRPLENLSESVEDSEDFPGGKVLEVLRQARQAWTPLIRLVTLDRQHRIYVLVETAVAGKGSGKGLMVALVMNLTEVMGQGDMAGDFVRQVRHDLRGPLTSMRGAVDLLLTERLGRLDPRQKKLIDLMDKAAHQMADLVSETAADPSDAPASGTSRSGTCPEEF